MIDKKWVVILVIVALLLAMVSVGFNMIDNGNEVSTTNYYTYQNTEDSEIGKIGVQVAKPTIEDKNAE